MSSGRTLLRSCGEFLGRKCQVSRGLDLGPSRAGAARAVPWSPEGGRWVRLEPAWAESSWLCCFSAGDARGPWSQRGSPGNHSANLLGSCLGWFCSWSVKRAQARQAARRGGVKAGVGGHIRVYISSRLYCFSYLEILLHLLSLSFTICKMREMTPMLTAF